MNDNINIYLPKMEKYCSYQERCTYDIIRKMKSLKIEEKYFSKILAHLSEYNMYSDDRYIASYIQSKVNIKKDGVNKIKFNLYSKRLDKEMIDKHLNDILEDQYHDNVEYLVEKKYLQLEKIEDKYKKNEKLIRYMMSKGYKYDDFKQFLK